MEKLLLCISCDCHPVCKLSYAVKPRPVSYIVKAMNPYRSGKLVLFQVTYDRDWHFFEIMFFIILGIFGVGLQVLYS